MSSEPNHVVGIKAESIEGDGRPQPTVQDQVIQLALKLCAQLDQQCPVAWDEWKRCERELAYALLAYNHVCEQRKRLTAWLETMRDDVEAQKRNWDEVNELPL